MNEEVDQGRTNLRLLVELLGCIALAVITLAAVVAALYPTSAPAATAQMTAQAAPQPAVTLTPSLVRETATKMARLQSVFKNKRRTISGIRITDGGAAATFWMKVNFGSRGSCSYHYNEQVQAADALGFYLIPIARGAKRTFRGSFCPRPVDPLSMYHGNGV